MKDKQEGSKPDNGRVKTVSLTAAVGQSDNCRSFYVLPPPVGSDVTNGHAGSEWSADGRHSKMTGDDRTNAGDVLSDQLAILHLASPSPSSYQRKDSPPGSHFIKQVNIPFDRTSHDHGHFSCQLVVDSFSETVSIPVLPSSLSAAPVQSCAAFCNFESDQRFRESIHLEPCLAANRFRVSVVCFKDSTKKRFRTTINCASRLRPRRFADTSFVQPKRKDWSFVSYVDQKQKRQTPARQWHVSTVTVRPRTACNNFVHGFEFFGDEDDEERSRGSLDDLDSVGSSGFVEEEGGFIPGQTDMVFHLSNGIPAGGYRARMVVGDK